MANTKRSSASAAQQREKVRQQRQQRLHNNPNVGSRTQQNKNARRRQSRRTPWLLIGGVLLAVVVVIGIFILLSRQPANTNTALSGATDATTLKAVTQVDPSTLSQVGTGGIQNPFQLVKGTPPPVLTGPTGKPEYFYYGANFCPYCAGQRWAMVVALSRFGTFSNLNQTSSSSTDVYPNTATFSFYQSKYTSQYIDFVPVEQYTNQSDGNGGYTLLQNPTQDQQQLVNTYDASPYTQGQGGFPFQDIGNRYIAVGPSYVPDILANMTQKDIAAQLSNPSSAVSQKILGSANYITAAICNITNNQPGSVCTSGAIPQIQQSLGKVAAHSNSTLIGTIANHDVLLPRRYDD